MTTNEQNLITGIATTTNYLQNKICILSAETSRNSMNVKVIYPTTNCYRKDIQNQV